MTVTGELGAHRDPPTEQLLATYGLTVRLAWLPLDQIDWDATAAGQVRGEHLDDETVDRYAAAVEAGSVFPAVIARRLSGGRWSLPAGAHRATAHERAGHTSVAAYQIVSDVDDRTLLLLAVEDNATHGKPLTNAERASAALAMIERHGINRAEAAGRAGINVGILDRHLAARAGLARANRLGFANAYRKLPSTTQARIQQATNRHGDHVFAEAVQSLVNARATTGQAAELAQQVSAAATADEALLVVEDWEAENYVGRASGPRRSVGGCAGEWRSHARALLDLDPAEVAASVLPADRAITLDQVARLALRCKDVARAITATGVPG